MTTSRHQKFFLILMLKNGLQIGHIIAHDEAAVATAVARDDTNFPTGRFGRASATEVQSTVAPVEAKTFSDVFKSFATVIRTYRNFLQLNLSIAPLVSTVIAGQTIANFARGKGNKRDDLSSPTRTVFEMRTHTFRELVLHQEEVEAAMSGAALLPEVMLIGLISAYDAFLANLLRVVFLQHPEMILTSDKTIKFSELSDFKSIEEARISLVDREIESVLRESHQEHFRWMENKFGTTLTQNLPALSTFVEICERRNLLTHTGGMVTAKYLTNCRGHGNLQSVQIGSKLTVDIDYYSKAVDIVCEIGMKLCWVLWRKFAKDAKETADRTLNETCYNLVVHRRYSVAEAILSFSSDVLKKTGGNDYVRRMMRVNLANSIRLQDRDDDAVKVLNADDWSAAKDDLSISVAAVRGDISEIIRLMNKIGSQGRPNAEDYRTWPIFRRIREVSQFRDAFESVFGEQLVTPKETEVTVPGEPNSLH